MGSWILFAIPIVVLVGLGAAPTARAIRFCRKVAYFNSREFREHRREVAAVVAEHNRVADYFDEIRRSQAQLGTSKSGQRSRLTRARRSVRGGKRRKHIPSYGNTLVHSCSLATLQSARLNPVDAFCRNFQLPRSDASLRRLEDLEDQITRMRGALTNLHRREASIAASLHAPKFIMKHYREEFLARTGIDVTPLKVPYQTYAFEYVSKGGQVRDRQEFALDLPMIRSLMETIQDSLRRRRSAAGQRALMTPKLREEVKRHDNYTCQEPSCGVSRADEPHLLLEVDHIIPVSKGGLSTRENLQTLCWQCNRRKGSKVLSA